MSDDETRRLIAELPDEDDDEPSEVTLVTGGQRVRVRAPQGSRPEIELSPMSTPPAKRAESEPPSSLPVPAKGAAHVLQNVKSWQHVVALAIIAAFLAFAISKGLALW